ncbi:uncharacterized protein LOC125015415 isoform X2 [Mugil cephalus]|uniref:uncharacterized protein LOC125015415 isoform X2 n=1 Tax=Mugil cephalus TaxID=48193 RepID=UPI001FB82C07|nr:uncharacterized protein LOC125015415 isoform X2 [Mugil cephalus]
MSVTPVWPASNLRMAMISVRTESGLSARHLCCSNLGILLYFCLPWLLYLLWQRLFCQQLPRLNVSKQVAICHVHMSIRLLSLRMMVADGRAYNDVCKPVLSATASLEEPTEVPHRLLHQGPGSKSLKKHLLTSSWCLILGSGHLVAKLDPTYILPSRQAVKAMVEQHYVEEKEKAEAALLHADSVRLTADMWTSMNMDILL